MGEVLAHASALRQSFQCRGVNIGALTRISTVTVDALHQIDGRFEYRALRCKARAGVLRELMVRLDMR